MTNAIEIKLSSKTVIELRLLTTGETKNLKQSLVASGLKCRVQISKDKGTAYIYHVAGGTFTPDQKAIIRDCLVMMDDFCSCTGTRFTKPESLSFIYSGMAIRAIA